MMLINNIILLIVQNIHVMKVLLLNSYPLSFNKIILINSYQFLASILIFF